MFPPNPPARPKSAPSGNFSAVHRQLTTSAPPLLLMDFIPADNVQPGDECLVCYEEFSTAQRVYKPRLCSHYFHLDCLTRALETKSVCPYCRAPILCIQCKQVIFFKRDALFFPGNCTHSFHKYCVDGRYVTANVCPKCAYDNATLPEVPEVEEPEEFLRPLFADNYPGRRQVVPGQGVGLLNNNRPRPEEVLAALGVAFNDNPGGRRYPVLPSDVGIVLRDSLLTIIIAVFLVTVDETPLHWRNSPPVIMLAFIIIGVVYGCCSYLVTKLDSPFRVNNYYMRNPKFWCEILAAISMIGATFGIGHAISKQLSTHGSASDAIPNALVMGGALGAINELLYSLTRGVMDKWTSNEFEFQVGHALTRILRACFPVAAGTAMAVVIREDGLNTSDAATDMVAYSTLVGTVTAFVISVFMFFFLKLLKKGGVHNSCSLQSLINHMRRIVRSRIHGQEAIPLLPLRGVP